MDHDRKSTLLRLIRLLQDDKMYRSTICCGCEHGPEGFLKTFGRRNNIDHTEGLIFTKTTPQFDQAIEWLPSPRRISHNARKGIPTGSSSYVPISRSRSRFYNAHTSPIRQSYHRFTGSSSTHEQNHSVFPPSAASESTVLGFDTRKLTGF